ncbi:MAG: c-type cytochrome biogenesis protein CcmF [Legionellales bacterium RIFCSPHIGHO2_12_FULL_35_11]|nr:MAG: c-type cytochrome biogenesis protein CcmF [Legionellales bacterium RIFCSPHIGHO2_12_FULL_35_11]
MIPEIGVFALCWCLLFSLLLVVVPTVGLYKKDQKLTLVADNYVVGSFIFILIAYFCLTINFLQDDFTVLYVLKNSSLNLPWFYKMCAVWGGHEGSMLLWIVILNFWTLAVSVFSKKLENDIRVRVLVILGGISSGLILFLLVTSNPFARQFQIFNISGQDLNPLLQDPGFIFHPPVLYMGYVGFSVAFSFAIAILWLGRIDTAWAKWVRPWTLAAWSCLTAGITLGSWWAYRELGWGGWWFWDPVENASFMPWLAGTALIHSLIASEKRGQFVSWTLLLAITAFSLSLVGTFLVRSGVLTSVHAFAVDPLRGLYILAFLFVVIGGSLILFMFRAHQLNQLKRPYLISKQSALILNNVFFVVAMLTVLMGTVYPLLIDAMGLGKLSVGAPYFNIMFIYIMMPMLFVLGLGIQLKWHKDNLFEVFKRLGWILILSIVLPWPIVIIFFKSVSILVYLSLFLAFWVILSNFDLLIKRVFIFKSTLSRSFLGMIISHIGVAIMVIGIAISSGYGSLLDVKMQPGEEMQLKDVVIKFIDETRLSGPNYHGARAKFAIISNNKVSYIYPEKRIYDVTKIPMTDSDIDITLFRDIYIALGEPLDEKYWSIRMYYKPLVRWIWAGGFLIFLGGLLALLDRKYFLKQ